MKLSQNTGTLHIFAVLIYVQDKWTAFLSGTNHQKHKVQVTCVR